MSDMTPQQIAHIQDLKAAIVPALERALNLRKQAADAIRAADETAGAPIKALVDFYQGGGPFAFTMPDGTRRVVTFRHVRDSSPDRYTVTDYEPKTAV